MFKKSVLFTALAFGLSLNAQAETFSTSVNVTKTLTPISVTESTPLVMPAVNVDEGTPTGVAICDSEGYDYYPANNYCSGAFSNGVYAITGSPSAEVRVTFPIHAITQNGMSWRGYYDNMGAAEAYNIFTDASGNASVAIHGIVHLENLADVTSGNTVFNFNLTAVYY